MKNRGLLYQMTSKYDIEDESWLGSNNNNKTSILECIAVRGD